MKRKKLIKRPVTLTIVRANGNVESYTKEVSLTEKQWKEEDKLIKEIKGELNDNYARKDKKRKSNNARTRK